LLKVAQTGNLYEGKPPNIAWAWAIVPSHAINACALQITKDSFLLLRVKSDLCF